MAEQEEDRDLTVPVVNDGLGYPISVGYGLGPEIRRFLRERGSPFVVLSDAQRDVLAAARIVAKVPRCKGVLAFPLGERRKDLRTLEKVLDALLAAGVDRATTVVGVGGGVAGDLFGFAAASYMRGVPYVHVATSLVSMADASVGGKTGVNLAGGKNLAGAFADPVAVFSDVRRLETLPFRSLREGLAEVVKAAIVEGGAFFETLETMAAHPFWRWPWVEIVAEAVHVKSMVVADDRLEAGAREVLNLGHTFGHAIERASAYRVTHGAALSVGLRAAGLLAMRTGRFSLEEHVRVLALLALLGLPLRTRVAPDLILAAMSADKKRRAGKLRFVLPLAIGDVEYGVVASERTVASVLRTISQLPDDSSES